MSTAHLVTGATGFVGGALVLELLKRTDDPVVCIVRETEDRSAQERMTSALEHACDVYGEDALLAAVATRCTAVAGDLMEPSCGVAPSELPAIGQVWHVAASLAFEDENEDEIIAANVGGTRAVVELASAAGAVQFNHVSTAYVGGARTGAMLEEQPPAGTPANNAYERSKLEAEQLVQSSDFATTRILRPSIVIGHSVTRAATTFTGLYGFVRNLRTLRREVDDVLGDLLVHRALRLIADPSAPINFIPVDAVARDAVSIGLADAGSGIYHLTNSAPPTVGEIVGVIAEEVGIRKPRYVDSADELSSIDAQVDDALLFYGPYIRSHRTFDRTRTDGIVGAGAGDHPMSLDDQRAYVQWYVGHLERRAAAREAKAATHAG